MGNVTPPGLPEDALLTLLPLPPDRVEILAVQVGVTAGAEPPATCEVREKGTRSSPWVFESPVRLR